MRVQAQIKSIGNDYRMITSFILSVTLYYTYKMRSIVCVLHHKCDFITTGSDKTQRVQCHHLLSPFSIFNEKKRSCKYTCLDTLYMAHMSSSFSVQTANTTTTPNRHTTELKSKKKEDEATTMRILSLHFAVQNEDDV